MSAREELEARLRKANSQLAELERAREERAEDARFEQEVIARERAVKDEHAIAEADAREEARDHALLYAGAEIIDLVGLDPAEPGPAE